MPSSSTSMALATSIAARAGDLTKLGLFFVFYTTHAWRTFNQHFCGQADVCYLEGYPCESAAWASGKRLWYHAVHPGQLFIVAFFRPDDPADFHDAISLVTFMLGGLLALALGPTAAPGRSSSKWRLAWLLLCVVIPKGFLIVYGSLHPTASLGAAVSKMLPRLTAVMLWLSFAFPLVWRFQALVGAVYVAHLLIIIRMVAERGWPYEGAALSPAALSARVVIASGISVLAAAIMDWRRTQAAAAKTAAKAAYAGVGLESRCPQAPHRDPHQQQRMEQNLSDASSAPVYRFWLGSLLAAAGLQPPPAAGPDGNGSSSDGNTSSSGKGGAGSHLAGGAVLTESSRRLSTLRQRRAMALSRASGNGSCQYDPTGTAVAGPWSPMPDERGTAFPSGRQGGYGVPPREGAWAQPPGGLSGPVLAVSGPAAAAAAAAAAAVAATTLAGPRAHGQARYRYRSVVQMTRMHIKIEGASPEQLQPSAAVSLSEEISAGGFAVSAFAVRSGCVEIILELERAPDGSSTRHGAVGGPSGSACGQSFGAGADLVRRVVSALWNAFRPVSGAGPSAAQTATDTDGRGSAGGAQVAGDEDAPGLVRVDGVGYVVRRSAAGSAMAGGDIEWQVVEESGAAATADDREELEERVASQTSLAEGSSAPALGAPVHSELGTGHGAVYDDWVAHGATAAGHSGAGCEWLPPPGPMAPLLALVPPCVVLPAPYGSSGLTTTGPLRPQRVLDFVLYMRNARLAAAPLSSGSGSAAQRGLPDVLVWQRGCFLQVLGMELMRMEGPGDTGPCCGYRIQVDATDLTYGLLTVAIQAPMLAPIQQRPPQQPPQQPRGSPTALSPLVATARALLLPPALDALALELVQPLAEEAMMGVADGDAEGAESVSEFIADLAAWLSHKDLLAVPPDPPRTPSRRDGAASLSSPRTGTPGHRTGLAAAASVDCPSCGAGRDASTASSACTHAMASTVASTGTTTSECSSATGAMRSLLGLSPTLRGRDMQGGAQQSVDWSNGSAMSFMDDYDSVGGGDAPWTRTSWNAYMRPPMFATAAGTAAGGDGEWAGGGGTGAGGAGGMPSAGTPRMLAGGRLDLRNEVADAVRRAEESSGALASAEHHSVMDERHWALLEHAARSGWPVTLQLLLGRPHAAPPQPAARAGDPAPASHMGGAAQAMRLLEQQQARGLGISSSAISNAWDYAHAQEEAGGATARPAQAETGVTVAFGPSLLHLAVASGVAAAIDLVIEASRHSGGRHACGLYGTWSTLATPELYEEGYSAVTPDMGRSEASLSQGFAAASAVPPQAAVTPLQVAAALEDSGALLSYVLYRYGEARAMYDEVIPGASASAADVAAAAGNAAAGEAALCR